jgi:phosphopantothenoylcysteine decarboxylase/phosphopantothenate--cysteine ligase
MLTGKNVVLGVTGGIAAYKAAEILRGLRKKGAGVSVVMTANARRFVGPLTFEALSGRPVAEDLFSPAGDARMEHLALAQSADLVLIAPATANTIAKLAAGLADDLLSTLVLATAAPVLIAPAMNTGMIRHRATEANLALLASRGVHVVQPESGPLAEEENGYGRLADPETIVKEAEALLLPLRDLAGKRVLVTAGPTREAVDPVRFFSNRSSGKMGTALAAEALRRGAAVTLVRGPVSLPPPEGALLVDVESADQMRAAVGEHFESSDVVIMTAAVADFRPAEYRPGKMKKEGKGRLFIEMESNPDILREIGGKKGRRILVGFAAETGDVTAAAESKLNEKNLDLLVANDVTLPGAGFECDTNQVEIFTRDGRRISVPLLPKAEVAKRILDEVSGLLGEDSGGKT